MPTSQEINSTHRSVSRLARAFQQLMRQQLSYEGITVQQCYTLGGLAEGPRTMKSLAADVGLHQSTLTRLVEKLESRGLVHRTRPADDQRTVHVTMTDDGRRAHAQLDAGCERIIASLLDSIPEPQQSGVVASLELLAQTLDPHEPQFRALLADCCETGQC